METSVPVKLGVAAECAELLEMETSVPRKLGVAREWAECAGMEPSVRVMGRGFTLLKVGANLRQADANGLLGLAELLRGRDQTSLRPRVRHG